MKKVQIKNTKTRENTSRLHESKLQCFFLLLFKIYFAKLFGHVMLFSFFLISAHRTHNQSLYKPLKSHTQFHIPRHLLCFRFLICKQTTHTRDINSIFDYTSLRIVFSESSAINSAQSFRIFAYSIL